MPVIRHGDHGCRGRWWSTSPSASPRRIPQPEERLVRRLVDTERQARRTWRTESATHHDGMLSLRMCREIICVHLHRKQRQIRGIKAYQATSQARLQEGAAWVHDAHQGSSNYGHADSLRAAQNSCRARQARAGFASAAASFPRNAPTRVATIHAVRPARCVIALGTWHQCPAYAVAFRSVRHQPHQVIGARPRADAGIRFSTPAPRQPLRGSHHREYGRCA